MGGVERLYQDPPEKVGTLVGQHFSGNSMATAGSVSEQQLGTGGERDAGTEEEPSGRVGQGILVGLCSLSKLGQPGLGETCRKRVCRAGH